MIRFFLVIFLVFLPFTFINAAKVGDQIEIKIEFNQDKGFERETFLLTKELGRGSFGIAYNAKSITTDRVVVFKFPITENKLNDQTVLDEQNRYISISKILEKSNNEIKKENQEYCFLKLYKHDNKGVLVFEKAKQDLHKYICEKKLPFDDKHIKDLMCPLIVSLKKLHDANSYHGDIKSDNIFVFDRESPTTENVVLKWADPASNLPDHNQSFIDRWKDTDIAQLASVFRDLKRVKNLEDIKNLPKSDFRDLIMRVDPEFTSNYMEKKAKQKKKIITNIDNILDHKFFNGCK